MRARILICLEGGQVVYLAHALAEMANDRISQADVEAVLRLGAFDGADYIADAWRYRLTARKVFVVIEFEGFETDGGATLIITAWRKKA